MRCIEWLARLLLTGTLCVLAGLAQATPQNGWWWNPLESGRGFFLEVQGDTLFVAGYFYAADGRATWLVSAGTIAANSYTGRLLQVSGGQSLLGDYKQPTEADAGEINLELSPLWRRNAHHRLHHRRPDRARHPRPPR